MAANRRRYLWTNIEHEPVELQPVDAHEFIEGGARLVNNKATAPCIIASHRCELCKTCSVPWCHEPHDHAASHYMFTKNPVLIQEGPARGRKHNRRSPPRVLAQHNIRHMHPTEGEGMMGLPPTTQRSAL